MNMKQILAAVVVIVWSAGAIAQTPVTHAELQAVNADGSSAWTETFPFTIQGVIVNDPEEMLDFAFNPEATTPPTGGQFQMFIQAAAEGDRGGTALYMGQRSRGVVDHYDEPTWSNEMQRVRFDSNGRKFRKGDWVEVTARKALFYNGKRNINEAHRTSVSNNFDIRLVQANTGLPSAEVIALTDLKHPDDSAIFDATRATGGEHWQGMRVRLDGIRLATTNGWGQSAWADRVCMATNDRGRSLKLRMPLTNLGPPKTTSEWFAVTGILNQEDSNTNGYELFVQEIGPVLHVTQGPAGGVALSFTTDYEGYVLEATDDLESGEWSPVDITPVRVIRMEDVSDLPNRAYRLRKVD